MAKSDEIIEKLHEIETDKAVEKAVAQARREWWKTTHMVCITATSAVGTALYNFGGWMYQNFEPLRIGIAAMIQAMRGHQ